MNFKTRPHFEDRQIVQYVGDSVKLSGDTLYANTGGITIEPTILDFTGSTSGQTTVTINGLTGYLNNDNRISGLVITPPKLKLSGSTGTTTVNVQDFVLKSIDSNGTVGWGPSNVFTGNTSGDCITDLYVSNIYGCSPITIWDSVQSVGSTASGNTSFAFGINNVASGVASFAEGDGTKSNAYTSHSEGKSTVANGAASHAEGDGSIASGVASHAEGVGTISSGYASHAGGDSSLVSGQNSFIHSTNSVLTGDDSVLLGGVSLTGISDNTVYVPNLTVRGDHILHSDNVLEVSILPNVLKDDTKGYFSSFSWSGLTTNILNNSNTSGYTSFLLGDLSSYPDINKHGFLSYYNTNYVRVGSPITGNNFYQDKLVLKSSKNAEGIVFSNDSLKEFWWEINNESKMLLSDSGSLGIGLNTDGTESPSEKLHVRGDILVENTSGKFLTDIENSKGSLTLLSGGTSDLPRIGVKTPSSDSITMGVRGVNEVSFPGYGKQGDSFVYSTNENNGLNILSTPGTGTEDYIRFYAGQDANGTTPDLYIQGSGSTRGYVGINTDSPTNYLDINNMGVEGFRIRSSYTPSSSGDTNGEVGTITWDDNYIYVKTSSGWGRSSLDYAF